MRTLAIALVLLGACDLRPHTEERTPAPAPAPVPKPVVQADNCPDGVPQRLVVERAGQRIMDIPTEELDKVRGAHKPTEGRYQGRLLIPLSVFGAKRIQIVPCMGNPVEIAASETVSLMPNKRGNLKLVSLEADAPLVKNIAMLRIVE